MTTDGLYEIVEMEIWDKDTADLAERAQIAIKGRKGTLHFIGFDARMDIQGAGDRYLFTWLVDNDNNPVSGYGNFTCSGDTLVGRIYMHDSYDSSFVAVKVSQEKKQIRMVNRGLLVMKAKEPFREWVASLAGKEKITLRDINQDSPAYLVPECENDLQKAGFIETQYADIFIKQLLRWCPHDSQWPRNRTLSLFNRWFELEYHTMLEDLAEDDMSHRMINPHEMR